jgi:hypothetical protein
VPDTPVIRRARAVTSPTAVISGLSKHWRTEIHVTCERTYTKGWDLVHKADYNYYFVNYIIMSPTSKSIQNENGVIHYVAYLMIRL